MHSPVEPTRERQDMGTAGEIRTRPENGWLPGGECCPSRVKLGSRVHWVGRDTRLPLTLKRFRKTRKQTQKRSYLDPVLDEGGGVSLHNSIFFVREFSNKKLPRSLPHVFPSPV